MKFSSPRCAFTTDKNPFPCHLKVLLKKLMYNLNSAIWEWASTGQQLSLSLWVEGPVETVGRGRVEDLVL